MTNYGKPARATLIVIGGTIETARISIGCRNTDEMRRSPHFMARNREMALLAYEALDAREAAAVAAEAKALPVLDPLQICPLHGDQRGWLELHHSEQIDRDSFGIIAAQLVHQARLECGCSIEVLEQKRKNEEHPANIQARLMMDERNA